MFGGGFMVICLFFCSAAVLWLFACFSVRRQFYGYLPVFLFGSGFMVICLFFCSAAVLGYLPVFLFGGGFMVICLFFCSAAVLWLFACFSVRRRFYGYLPV